MMILDKVTITGADDSVAPADLVKISQEFPFVEWALLLSRDKVGTPRFPTHDWLRDYLLLATEAQLSAHVCGEWTRSILAAETPNSVLLDFLAFFQRVQLNFNSRRETGWKDEFVTVLPKGKQYIFQIGAFGNVAMYHAIKEGVQCAALFDKSGGKGVTPGEWPEPLKGVYCGYAGGLGPDNITSEIEKISQVVPADGHIWIDMESNIRSDEKLDLAKVRACLEGSRPWTIHA